MFEALVTLWRSLRDWSRSAPVLILLNILWIVSLPTLILWPLITAVLMLATNRIAYGEPIHARDLMMGMRAYLWVSMRWGLVTAGAVASIYLNSRLPTCLGLILLLLAWIWFTLQLYLWPFLLEQEDKRLLKAVTNSLLLGIAAPAYTISLLFYVGTLLVIALSVFAPAALFLASYFALAGNITVIEHLRTYGRVPNPAYAVNQTPSVEAPPTDHL